MLQKDGAVTQIFGNHLFIQGRVEDETGIFRTSLRLQGNRWFGSCTAEDELIAGACQYATMMERMHRGEDLPESPNEFDDTPVLDIIEEKLGAKVISVPAANYDNNQHAENENMLIRYLWEGMETFAALMTMR